MTDQVRLLPVQEYGPESGSRDTGAPVVLLHGFGGDAVSWANIQTALSRHVRSLAFDLPGHGAAVDWPEIGHAGMTAKAVSTTLDGLSLDKVHLVGHSMGGAIATLIALRAPERIASLTLLAPGGFGEEINHRLLRRYASARDEEQIQMLLEQFFGWESLVPRKLAAHIAQVRSRPGAIEALETIVEAIIDGERQKTLPRDKLGELPCPVKVIWGTQDRVLPTRQAHRLPGSVAAHVFERVGHMLQVEIPREVARLVLENVRAGTS
ncbi:pyruvate dehydrogenase E2 component (dihydrolipoamide acetyltransferase) [Breoghania corrubedonensis]|uniref:Pyruvate dehydrogenase E2 component (Dihydrolipoamide acetyltransferase) n=1 Tax=Breoghania corrubedonensis TaxID=665038 RepID=A0A2T5V5V2_9HYPH|nr:alpha/beta fold hydrolase [Breoghania corrubedonensis]PTW59137.1 pyruvate dehydrogenase E2 component (dihydrolipoamide acetyltransferase) [Breoghania corrubedonensis]